MLFYDFRQNTFMIDFYQHDWVDKVDDRLQISMNFEIASAFTFMLNINYQIKIRYNFYLMAKANSFKNEPWTSLEERNFDLFDSDFVHDKLLTKKINKKTDKSGISLSTSLTQK